MNKDYNKIARTVISTEIEGLKKLRKSINSSFNKAVELILKAKNVLSVKLSQKKEKDTYTA